MFKRVIWMGLGAAAGSAGTVWAQRKVKERIDVMSDAISPEGLSRAARDRAVYIGATVRAAVEDGRMAARAADADLRALRDARLGPQPPSTAPRATGGRAAAPPRR